MKNSVKFVVPCQKGEYDYIGFDIESAVGQFVFPCRYIELEQDTELFEYNAEREKQIKSEAKKIIALIKQVQQDFLLGGSGEETFQFYSMIWLIRDYIDNGYYTETERVVCRGDKGRIDWKHTFKHSGIYFDGINIIYRDFYIQKNMLNNANIIAQIYKCCLTYSAERLGFLYNVSQTERSVYNIESSSDVAFMSYQVQRELNKTFNSYKRQLLQNLLTILKGRQGNIRAVSLCMHDKEFEYVFEFLVNSVFGTEKVHDFYNEYRYCIGGKLNSASKLRPDTIMKNNQGGCPDFYVLDAKYYNYGYSGNPRDLPQAAAIAKQISYNYYLHDNFTIEDKTRRNTFYSVFLLPFSKGSDVISTAQDAIRYIGYATNNADIKPENKVAVCCVDLKTLVDVYFGLARDKDGDIIAQNDMRNALITAVADCFNSCKP